MSAVRAIELLRKIRRAAFEGLERTVSEAAESCAESAREMAPVGTGPRVQPHLKDSFSCSRISRGYIAEARAAVCNTHAAYVEFGTGRRGADTGSGSNYDPDWAGMPAQPYMQPAAEACRNRFHADAVQAVRQALGG